MQQTLFEPSSYFYTMPIAPHSSLVCQSTMTTDATHILSLCSTEYIYLTQSQLLFRSPLAGGSALLRLGESRIGEGITCSICLVQSYSSLDLACHLGPGSLLWRLHSKFQLPSAHSCSKEGWGRHRGSYTPCPQRLILWSLGAPS